MGDTRYYDGLAKYHYLSTDPKQLNPADLYKSDQPTIIYFKLSAENLRAADKNGKSDPYVVFDLRVDGKLTTNKTDHIKADLNPSWRENFRITYSRNEKADPIEFFIYDKDVIGKDEFLGYASVDLSKYVAPNTTELFHRIKVPLGPAPTTKSKTASKIQGNFIIRDLEIPQELWTCKEEIDYLKTISGCTDERLLILYALQYKQVFFAPNTNFDQRLALWTILAETKLFKNIIDCGKQFAAIDFDLVEQKAIFGNHDVQLALQDHFFALFDNDNDGKVSLYDFVVTAVRFNAPNAAASLATAYFKAFDLDKDGVWTRAEVEKLSKNVVILQAGIAQALYSHAVTQSSDAHSIANPGPNGRILMETIQEAYFSGKAINSRIEAIFKVMDRGNKGVITHDDFVQWYTDPTGRARLFDTLLLLPGNQVEINEAIYKTLSTMKK